MEPNHTTEETLVLDKSFNTFWGPANKGKILGWNKDGQTAIGLMTFAHRSVS
jgi:hypothetical protein